MTQVNPEETHLAGNSIKPSEISQDPDLPAESIRICIDDDGVLGWLESLQYRPVYERDNSTKGTTNPKSQHHRHQKNPNPNSQRFSGDLKAMTKAQIIGLPGSAVNSGFLGYSSRRRPPLIFPPKKGTASDPGSPHVSCFGRVQSGGGRRRSPEAEEDVGGCWSVLAAWLRRGSPVAAEERNVVVPAEGRGAAAPTRSSRDVPAVAVDRLPGLGAMRKFVPGRRSASWEGEVDVDPDGGSGEEGHVPWSGPLIRKQCGYNLRCG